MRSTALFAFAALGAAIPALSSAQTLGIQAGLFYPGDSRLRDALGGQWLSFGVGKVDVGIADKSRPIWNWRSLAKSKDGNVVWMVSGSYGYLWSFNKLGPFQERADVRPYFAVRGGLVYIDYALDVGTDRLASKRLGVNFNAELGVAIGNNFTVSARYDINSRFDDLRFDGLTLSAQYALFRF